jgi:tetratricopeptide (TPR) repeat protein
MNDSKNDIGPDEQELLEKFGTSFEDLRAHHTDCPKPEVLLASHAGVLDAETARNIGSHLEKCDFCRILLRDLTDAGLYAARPEEERRVHERVLRAAKAAGKAEAAGGGLLAVWFRRAVPVAALAAVALAAVVWLRLHPVTPVPTQATVEVKQVQPQASSVLQWEKLPIKLQASSVLVLRGKPQNAKEKYAADLTAALASYRDDNYSQAAQQLAKVAQEFPGGVEAQLYLGISRLQLQQNAEAIAPLSSAQKLGPAQFSEDASWFLALAYERTHDTSKAIDLLQKMCQDKGVYSQRACAGIQELSARPGDKPWR